MTDPQTTDPPADPEAERIETLDARFGKIETEQAAQGGKLDQILSRLGGGTSTGAAKQEAAPAPAQDPGSIADQVRQAVQAVGAEQAARDAADAHERDHQALKEMREKPPRESTQGWRGKLQRAMYGKEPS